MKAPRAAAPEARRDGHRQSTRPVDAGEPGGRRTIARRILLSFAVALTAFALTVGFGVNALANSRRDNEELARGLVPLSLAVGQLRATQATMATLVDGVSDEKDPVAAKHLLRTLESERAVRLDELGRGLDALQSLGPELARLGVSLRQRLSGIEASVARDRAHFEVLFAALGAGDSAAVTRELVQLGAIEHDATSALRAMSERVDQAIDQRSEAAAARVTRSVLALFGLALGTLGLGLFVSWRTRHLLRPLTTLLARARAVAAGDLVPREVPKAETELGELEQGFEQMVAAVAEERAKSLSNERLAAIGKMAAHVTHEIRNPLNSIGLNLELLEEELFTAGNDHSDDHRELLAAIRREVERLERLSEEYLRLARVPSPRKETGDLAALLRELGAFEQRELTRSGCSLELHCDEPVPEVAFDDGQIRQSIVNLLRNARESMPQGGRIDVSLQSDGLYARIEVADRGSGIPEDVATHMFDPFFSTKGQGTGLGLAITRQVVEAHGGRIAHRPREGGGSVMSIWLPLAIANTSRQK